MFSVSNCSYDLQRHFYQIKGIPPPRNLVVSSRNFRTHGLIPSRKRQTKLMFKCLSKNNDANDQNSEESIRNKAKIRSEVNAPFRTVRMFFSLAFIASASVGALISLPKLIASVGGAPNAASIDDTLVGLAIDLVAIAFFVFLYRSDSQAEKKSVARFTREETLSKLRLELWNKRVTTIGQLRGARRLLIISGPKDHIIESFKRANPLKSALVERGVLIVPYFSDGGNCSAAELLSLFPEDSETTNLQEPSPEGFSVEDLDKRFLAFPLYTNEWSKWLKDQMVLAGVSEKQPVYISLRIDGRVRASGVGFPPFKVIAAQLPPLKGIWAGPLDGMDGRVF